MRFKRPYPFAPQNKLIPYGVSFESDISMELNRVKPKFKGHRLAFANRSCFLGKDTSNNRKITNVENAARTLIFE